ncbi:zinc ribbon domain-containing protein [Paraflavitalea speifideaquila]|uniref:zinc ribbon domain-containing protein n=1 Tax=Paraflavitalea speifideaquila TaxID=3076558 RepID=UPI0028EF5F1A|nr:zinc ribbon domain-containing protein [Paraflavitalea speifideiaquila]
MQNNEDVPLRGVLHCWCGRKMTAGNSKSKSGRYYWYYLCKDHKKNLSAVTLHSQFLEILDHLSLTMEALKQFKEVAASKLESYLNLREANLSTIRNQLTIIENKILAAEERYLTKPDISESSYNKVMTGYKAERSRLYEQLAKGNTNQEAYWTMFNELLLRMTDIRGEYERSPLGKKQRIVDYVFDHSLYYQENSYRTPRVHELFSHNLKTLNEKGY